MRVVVAVRGPANDLVDDLRAEGADVVAVVPPSDLVAAVGDGGTPDTVFAAELLAVLGGAHVLVVDAGPDSVTPTLVARCDREGVRMVVRCERDADRAAAKAFGLRTVGMTAAASELLDPEPPAPAEARTRGRVIAVWGAAGAPGRTTMAIALASELARDGRRVALIDADTSAPSMALAIGLADEGPGFAAACRQAERGTLTVAELARIAAPLAEGIAVLTGINRPARWPELSADRVHGALEVCREWADDIVVDVAACLELDEEIVSDLDGPRRNAAARAVLGCADIVVAVVASDPVGVSRFIRAYPELRATVGSAPVRVLVNKTRPRVLGVDPRGQVRRTLERYAGIGDMWFAPADGRAVDAALLRAQPVLQVAARSPLVAAVRRFVGEALEAPLRRRRADRSARRPRTRARGGMGSL